MPAIEGLQALISKLQQLQVQVQGIKGKVITGYSQSYALIVHEDLNARHKEGKQAKFLEGPARAHQNEIAETVAKAYRSTGNLDQSLILGALRLQKLSQEVVPIDTGALRASAYTAFEQNAEAAASKALFNSELVRQEEKAAKHKK